MHPHIYHPCVLLGRVHILLHPEMGRCISACLSDWNKRLKGKIDCFNFQFSIFKLKVENWSDRQVVHIGASDSLRAVGANPCYVAVVPTASILNFHFSMSKYNIENWKSMWHTRRDTGHHLLSSCQCWVSSIFMFFNVQFMSVVQCVIFCIFVKFPILNFVQMSILNNQTWKLNWGPAR